MEFSNSSFVDLVNPEKLFFIGNRNFEFIALLKREFGLWSQILLSRGVISSLQRVLSHQTKEVITWI